MIKSIPALSPPILLLSRTLLSLPTLYVLLKFCNNFNWSRIILLSPPAPLSYPSHTRSTSLPMVKFTTSFSFTIIVTRTYTYKYICISKCIVHLCCTHKYIYKYNLFCLFLLFMFMPFQLTALFWITNNGVPIWDRVILLLLVIIGGL